MKISGSRCTARGSRRTRGCRSAPPTRPHPRAQRAVEEPAEEELLGDRRDDDHRQPHGDRADDVAGGQLVTRARRCRTARAAPPRSRGSAGHRAAPARRSPRSGVARRPKCHGWGLTRREAKNTAMPTSAASWTSTSTSSAMPATASPASVSRATGSSGKPAAMVTPKAEKKAAGAIHGGQRRTRRQGQLGVDGGAQRRTATKSSARSSGPSRSAKSPQEIAGVKRS